MSAPAFLPQDDALVDTMLQAGIRYKNTAKWLSRLVFAVAEMEDACNPTDQMNAFGRVRRIMAKLGVA